MKTIPPLRCWAVQSTCDWLGRRTISLSILTRTCPDRRTQVPATRGHRTGLHPLAAARIESASFASAKVLLVDSVWSECSGFEPVIRKALHDLSIATPRC